MLNTPPRATLHGLARLAPLARYRFVVAVTVAMVVISAGPVPATAQEHHHYKLIVLGTLGGPQGFGDGGHGAANINNRGIAASDADTATLNPNSPGLDGINNPDGSLDPYVHHTFLAQGSVLTDLGALPGAYNSSSPTFITENGWVAGVSSTGKTDPFTGWNAEHAVLWKDGKIIDLGTLGGFESGMFNGMGQVNSKGEVTGFATNDVPDPFSVVYGIKGFTNGTQTRAFRWDAESGMHDLGTLGGPDAFGFFINERGQIAGAAATNFTLNPVTGNVTVHPFLWENGTMTDLGTLGGTLGFPSGLNNRGEVVGMSNLAGDVCSDVFLWSAPGPMRDLGSALGGCFSQPTAMNEDGEFVGPATTPNQKVHAFIWKNGTFTDLGSLPDLDDTCVGAFGINSRGQAVGQATENHCFGPRAHAFLWEHGSMIDLNVFVPPGTGITLTDVERINDNGEMFGSGTLANGEFRAFFLIPCDEEHPDIEGCDYSPLELSTVAANHATETTPQKQLTPQEISRIWDLLMNRHRGFVSRTVGSAH